ncbi:MAG TPA: hypothetical protein VF795_11780 [Desulfuromonadaceae bacterium]
MSAQMALFDTTLPEGSLDISLGLKQLLSRQLHGYDRYMVAAIISRATCKDLSKEMLDKILSSDVAYQPSALQTTAISALTHNLKPFQYLLEPLGSDVLDPADRDLIELARLQEEHKKIETRMMEIRTRRNLK